MIQAESKDDGGAARAWHSASRLLGARASCPQLDWRSQKHRAGRHIARGKVLGSIEFGCAVAGAKLILVMGHTSCGAVNAAVDFFGNQKSVADATGCANLGGIITEIQLSVDPDTCKQPDQWLPGERAAYANEVSRRNILRTKRMIRERSPTIDKLVTEGKVAIVGALYDISTGEVSFFQTPQAGQAPLRMETAAAIRFPHSRSGTTREHGWLRRFKSRHRR